MKIISPLLSKASGSMAGTTASRNRGGMYFRGRAKPVNPNTPAQQVVRNAMSQLTSAWTQQLTQDQRDAWTTYANNTPVIDKLGASIVLTGSNMYIRGNSPRIQAGLSRIDDGPGDFGLPTYTPVVVSASHTAQHISTTFTAGDDWANEDDAAMLVYVSRPMGVGINFFKGPFAWAGNILGDAMTPPTSPAVMTAPFAFVAGQVLFIRVQVSDGEGRLSSDQITRVMAT